MLRHDDGPTLLAYGLTAAMGAGAAALVLLGNPGNMGICGACFLRDLAGALGFFEKGPKIFRPELVGLFGGALLWMAARGRFTARSGSYAAARFTMGVLMGIGALVFLGCPFRMLQRIGGGDVNAMIGCLGFVGGVGIGLWFEKRGYAVGRTAPVPAAVGLLGPALIGGLFGLAFAGGLAGPAPGEAGPPAHAPWIAAAGIAAIAAVILSATGFCAISAARQVFLGRGKMLAAAFFFILAYGVVAAIGGAFKLGVEGQPVAHDDYFWNMASLVLVGLTGVLAGGCPVRQMVMAGEGNGDAFMTVAGLVVGGGAAHSLGLASSGAGTTPGGRIAVVAGLVLALLYAASVTASHRTAR